MQEAPSRVQAFKPAKLEGMNLRTHSRSWLNSFYFDGVVGGGISFLKCPRNEGRGYGFLKQFLQEERCLGLQVNLEGKKLELYKRGLGQRGRAEKEEERKGEEQGEGWGDGQGREGEKAARGGRRQRGRRERGRQGRRGREGGEEEGDRREKK